MKPISPRERHLQVKAARRRFAQQAALEFHYTACSALGIQPSMDGAKAAVIGVLGVPRQRYSEATTGARVSTDRVIDFVRRWNENRLSWDRVLPELELCTRGTSAMVRNCGPALAWDGIKEAIVWHLVGWAEHGDSKWLPLSNLFAWVAANLDVHGAAACKLFDLMAHEGLMVVQMRNRQRHVAALQEMSDVE